MSNESQKIVYRVVPEGEPVQFQAADGTGTVRRPAPCDGLWGRAGESLFWIPLEALRKDLEEFDEAAKATGQEATAEAAPVPKVKAPAGKGKTRGKR